VVVVVVGGRKRRAESCGPGGNINYDDGLVGYLYDSCRYTSTSSSPPLPPPTNTPPTTTTHLP